MSMLLADTLAFFRISSNFSDLRYLCDSHGAAIAHLLLEAGHPLETRDKFGSTPLHVASIQRNVNIVKVLLEHGKGLPHSTAALVLINRRALCPRRRSHGKGWIW